MIDYRVYLVTDDPSRYRRDWLDMIAAAIDGGVTCVQYRDTESPAKVRYERLLKLKDLLSARGVPLVVNNEAELAAAVKAEGVHVGQGDRAPADVRRIVGPRCEIGLSITALGQVEPLRPQVVGGFVDVIGIGPVYDARATKADAAAEMGLDGLRSIVTATAGVRNVAIGGVTAARAADVVAAGAGGLAIVSALSRVEDPCAAARLFRRVFE